MGLNKYNHSKLLHDIKRIGAVVNIITDEKDEKKRKIIANILRDEMDRVLTDIEEMKDNGDKKTEDKKE